MPRVLAASMVLAALIATPLPAANAQTPAPARVVTEPARMEPVEQFHEAPGELRASMRSTIAARQSGLVVQINVEPGGRVESGKVIGKLDDRFARIEVTRAEASLAARRAAITQQQASLDKARRNTARYESAFKASGVTESELDEARTTQAEAEARLAQAQAESLAGEAELALARERFQDMTIRAPFTGVVVRRRAEAGEWVTQGAPVVELVATQSIDAWFEVPGALAGTLRAGQGGNAGGVHGLQVRVPSVDTGNGGDLVAGAIEAAVMPASEPGASPDSVILRARLDNPDQRLAPGMRIIGLLPSGQRRVALTVPASAVHRRDLAAHVVFDASGAAAIAPVTVLSAHGDRLVVDSAVLKEGMEVVVEGAADLTAGQPLSRVPRAATGQAEAGTRGK